jgi:hypothetical protein
MCTHDLELPSDLSGVVYVPLDCENKWAGLLFTSFFMPRYDWMRARARMHVNGYWSNDCRPSPISPPLVKCADLPRPVVESRRRTTVKDNFRTIAFRFSAVFVSSAGFHPPCGAGPNTY